MVNIPITIADFAHSEITPKMVALPLYSVKIVALRPYYFNKKG